MNPTTAATVELTTAERIEAKCRALADFLIEKNRSYGDSALRPVGIFSQGDPVALIRIRIDDKLSRLASNPKAYGEDVVRDLLGYLILLQIAEDLAIEGKTHP